MTDDPRNSAAIDHDRINTSQPWEIKYWTERFGVSEQTLKDAVFTVGTASEDVKRYLEKQ